MMVDTSGVSLSDILAAAALVGTIYNFVAKPGNQALKAVEEVAKDVAKKVDHEELAAVQGKVERADSRIAVLEGNVAHLPDKDMAHRLELAITRFEGQLGAVEERLRPIAAISDRLQDFLLDQVKER